MTQEAIDDFYPDALATRTVDGKIYGLPMEQEPLAIFYDVPAFEEAGLSEGDLPTTWEEMLELGRRLTGGQRAGLVFDTTPSYYQNFTFYPWVWQGGGNVVDPDTQRPAIDSDAGVQALGLFRDAVRPGHRPARCPRAATSSAPSATGTRRCGRPASGRSRPCGRTPPTTRTGSSGSQHRRAASR